MTVLSCEEHRKGKRLYGFFIEQENGLKVYVALRRHQEIYRDRKENLSQAMREGRASWALDVETLVKARAKEVNLVVVVLKKRGEFYVTSLSRFLNPDNAKLINWSGRGGSLQRALPLQFFLHVQHGIRI